ncbi:hypothetical protein M378DRAFT_76026 [Amanita muscaria Koide BX008]|uniref:Protein-S-isoprenylcysteine O-methyltransferase n=1 Tax=Amanita muscaria (strain Koide BX008) TaxID=946122 RepID=A0A0C2XAJ1_AMAMK|nr:hypothetical protein M378DRAFT_76026 [Amanita muscaria Koide BX008]
MVSFQRATTAPNPPPSPTESAASNSLECFLRQRLCRTVVQTICWTTALSEAAVIVANHFDKDNSSQILTSLALTCNPDTIQPSPMFFLGTFLTAFGGYIRCRCYKTMGRMFTFEMSIRRDHHLVTSGPYSVVRHPSYTGILCTVVGFLLWNLSPGSWATECGALISTPGQLAFWTYSLLVSGICVGLVSRMFKEDEALHERFGEAWEVWARAVPYMLIPGVY